jgi:hypothetical protein
VGYSRDFMIFFQVTIKIDLKLGMGVHTGNPSTLEAEVGGFQV